MAINQSRVRLGALAGGAVFTLWTVFNAFVIAPAIEHRSRVVAALDAGLFLKEPRLTFPTFFVVWTVSLFIVAYGLAWAYAGLRATYGAGPRTAAKLGLAVGFAMAFPLEFAHAVFQGLVPAFWITWMIEMGVGGFLAALTAAWVYRD
jgi:hypothetical protein